MTPSIPKSLPNGSRKSAHLESSVTSPTDMFARSHSISPAGAATVTALPRTNTVLSRSERTSTLPICGRRYGGSSRAKEVAVPFRTVFERNRDIIKVRTAPRAMTPVSISALAKFPPLPATASIPIRVISAGNRPLQGIKTLVRMAICRSLGESIILHPVTPAALQPRPIAIVRACFPQAFARLKYLSRLNAARGRYPTSSRRVKRGKNIAIGGSITDVTQVRTRYTPSMSILSAHSGQPAPQSHSLSTSPSDENAEDSHSDG